MTNRMVIRPGKSQQLEDHPLGAWGRIEFHLARTERRALQVFRDVWHPQSPWCPWQALLDKKVERGEWRHLRLHDEGQVSGDLGEPKQLAGLIQQPVITRSGHYLNFLSVLFVKKNPSGKYWSLTFLPTNLLSWYRTFDGLFELTQFPSRAFNLALWVPFGTADRHRHRQVCCAGHWDPR